MAMTMPKQAWLMRVGPTLNRDPFDYGRSGGVFIKGESYLVYRIKPGFDIGSAVVTIFDYCHDLVDILFTKREQTNHVIEPAEWQFIGGGD